jgi:hypothetical protein
VGAQDSWLMGRNFSGNYETFEISTIFTQNKLMNKHTKCNRCYGTHVRFFVYVFSWLGVIM